MRRLLPLARRVLPPRVRTTVGGWYDRIRAVAGVVVAPLIEERVAFLARTLARRDGVAAYTLRGSDVRFHVRHRSPDLFALGQAAGEEAPYALPARAEQALRALGRPPRVADLGANIGLFTATLLRRWPDAEVVAYEPEPANAALVRRSIAANPRRRWELVEACAGAAPGEAEFVLGDFATSHIAAPGEDAPTARVPVEDVFPRLQDVDLLKVDIEGAEWTLLADPRFAALPARVVAFEYHARDAPGEDPRAEAQRRLSAAGFESEEGDLRAPPGHGMLWAYRT